MQYKLISENELVDYIKCNLRDIDIDMVLRAIEIAEIAHKNQRRDSGEAYITHPLNVAFILAQLHCDTDTICAGILHDTVEDTSLTSYDIKTHFNSDIQNLVEGVTKLDTYQYKRNKDQLERQAENFRKLLIYTVKDYRVLLLKLADRLHNMRTLQYVSPEKSYKIASETLEIYAPLANRFGLALIRWELEDLAFKYLQPEEYRKIVDMVVMKRHEREQFIQACVTPVKSALLSENLEAEVYGRSKHFYSIYKKHIKKKISYNDIYDLAAIRIITKSVEDCYRVLGIIHSIFQPLEKRFKDYISRPKANHYQSLHSIVLTDKGKKIEFQIRTLEMHKIAEEGIAAHWKYKEKDIKLNIDFENQIKSIRKLLNKDFLSGQQFIEDLKSSLIANEIIIITPNGDLVKLQEHSTLLDFAFAIHSDIGLTCIGGRVNGKFVPLKTELKNGDKVYIITNSTAKPSIDWLQYVKTNKARSEVRSYFKKKAMEDSIIIGKELFEKRIRKSIYKYKKEVDILLLARNFKLFNLDDFYSALGNGKLDFQNIISYLENKDNTEVVVPGPKTDKEEITEHDIIYLDDINNLMLKFAKCCNPKPGDDIVGYVTRGKGITIHRTDCTNSNFKKIEMEEAFRLFKISWSKQAFKNKSRTLKICGEYNNAVHYEIVKTLTSFNVNVISNKFNVGGIDFSCIIKYDNKHFKNIKLLINQLKKIKGINKVTDKK